MGIGQNEEPVAHNADTVRGGDIARNVDQRDIDAALPKLVAWAETMAYRKG